MPYIAPLRDIHFTLEHIVGFQNLKTLPVFESLSTDMTGAVLAEAGKLAADVLAPLNMKGDREGCTLKQGQVRMPAGFREAYQKYVEGGWNSLSFSPDHGGQGLPWTLGLAVQEMWCAANTSFALCPLLNVGAVELLSSHGTENAKQVFLSKMIAGTWTGTMNLTEPQAGSDVGAVRTRAVKEGEHYRITGQKIFITYGDHDLTENIIHMVLARLPGAPAGTKGLSLFLVPKYLVRPDGSLSMPNDVKVASIEHKLGIHASPTAVMSFGEQGGALGYLVGEENGGMAAMFTMMNNARLGIGCQGMALISRAYQQALAYAKTRVQGTALGSKNKSTESVTILHHPDVRRMLMTMKAYGEATRALVYTAGLALDQAKHHPDQAVAAQAQARVDLLTPITKAWCTDLAVEMTSLGIQAHGGMGYIEETGAAQHWRDSRITPIYEGTNGIQANDLVFRKIARDQGAAMKALLAEIGADVQKFATLTGDDLTVIAQGLGKALEILKTATDWVLTTTPQNPVAVASGAVAYLQLCGLVIGGWLMGKGAVAAQQLLASSRTDSAFYESKIITARFYAEVLLPGTAALWPALSSAHRSVMALDEGQF